MSSHKFRAPTTTGVSLNDAQLIVVLIAKMYRQVLVHADDRNYQRILWRSHPSKEIQEYQLNTVTYGLASAPHCAIRALQQCAYDHQQQFSIASRIVLSSFYVDDLLCGGETVEEVEAIHAELNALLACGQFQLLKWSSNSWALLQSMNNTDSAGELSFDSYNDTAKSVLGLKWIPGRDVFVFKIAIIDLTTTATKRTVISQISRLYDPNGYLCPVIIVAKNMIQKLWKQKIDWDEPVPAHLFEEWSKFEISMPALEQIEIPRWLGMTASGKTQLHDFCDASQVAFGAVVYARTENLDGQITVQLISAKSRVAPVKVMTIPRLELCAAQLLTQLTSTIRKAYPAIESIWQWSDSEIALHWIHREPGELKTYVANRVQQIQTTTDELQSQWLHVPTHLNLAHLASRGVMPDELAQQSLWWQGSSFLLQQQSHWPQQKIDTITLRSEFQPMVIAEERPTATLHLVSTTVQLQYNEAHAPWYVFVQRGQVSIASDLLATYSSVHRLERITAQRWFYVSSGTPNKR